MVDINMFISDDIYLSFIIFYTLPRGSYKNIQCGSFPVESGGSETNPPVPLGIGKLALNNLRILDRYMDGVCL